MDWQYFELRSRDQSYWVETVSSIQDIKIYNYERPRRWKWEAIQAGLYKVNKRVLTINNTQNLGAQFIDSIKNMAIVFYCATAVIRGEITFGVMISSNLFDDAATITGSFLINGAANDLSTQSSELLWYTSGLIDGLRDGWNDKNK